jgi:hypothetical protein
MSKPRQCFKQTSIGIGILDLLDLEFILAPVCFGQQGRFSAANFGF